MAHTTVVSPLELAERLDDPDWIVFDCRIDLANPAAGRAQYLGAHIPGARFMDVETDLSGAKNGSNGRHPLPDPEAFAAKLGSAGVDATKQVVAYDAHGAMFAARLWWMLRWLGHDAVAVLDGGFTHWLKDDLPETRVLPTPVPRRFEVRPQPLAVDTAFVASQLGAADTLIVDARAADRYRGENETLDPVAGHIPGAVNRFFKDNLDASGRFKPAAQLREEWHAILGGRAAGQSVHQCGSGVTACHNLLALELAGLPGGRLYAGSWSEWCADPARPVSTGAAP